MKARWHVLIPVLALVFQVVPPLLLRAIAWAAYGEMGNWLQNWERPVSLLVIGLSAGAGLLLGSVGAYGLLTRVRPRTAVVLIAGCCLPAVVGGAVYLHGLLVFLAWV